MSRSTVSVVIATYNCSAYLPAAIDSLLAQSVLPDQIVIVDDGSTDETTKLLKRYERSILYIRQDNQGEPRARTAGIVSAHGDYVAILDADDLCHKERLERQRDLLDASGAIACFSGHWVFGEAGKSRSFTSNAQLVSTDAINHLAKVMVHPPTIMFDRRRALGLYYADIPIGGDLIFLAQLRTRGEFTACSEPLYGYRRRPGQTTAIYGFEDSIERRLAWLELHAHEFWPGRLLADLKREVWRGAATTLETLYWARRKTQFLRLRNYLQERWPVDLLPRPDALLLHWYPGWVWHAKDRLDAIRSRL